MFNLKINASEGGKDAAQFANELSEIITKTTGVVPVSGLFRL